ncbi:50S ribosomal protein L18e [Candidatus Woesearchaeota archaeon]|nr:50S ribosomal protein L18e [Candidatus Woesearchaeota archaeon]
MDKHITKTNELLLNLVVELKKTSTAKKAKIWKAIALELLKPTRKMREVNIDKINRVTKPNDIIVVPGKVLGKGNVDHNVTVAAFNFSESAKQKLKDNLSIHELMKKHPKGTGVKIIG